MRSEHQKRVDEFMILAKQEVPEEIQINPSDELRILRAKLIYEEVVPELIKKGLGIEIRTTDYHDNPTSDTNFDYIVARPFNLEETIDGCCDAKVVITGTLSALGVPDEPFQELVDVNNLAKFGPGGYRAEGESHPTKPGPLGKWIKPPGHKPPDIAGLVDAIRREYEEFPDDNRPVEEVLEEKEQVERMQRLKEPQSSQEAMDQGKKIAEEWKHPWPKPEVIPVKFKDYVKVDTKINEDKNYGPKGLGSRYGYVIGLIADIALVEFSDFQQQIPIKYLKVEKQMEPTNETEVS